jgi:hypothetical protein
MIKYLDDGKSKRQSHEGLFEADGCGPDWNFTVSVAAYGPDKAHVRINLRAAFDEIDRRLQRARLELDLPNAEATNAGGSNPHE